MVLELLILGKLWLGNGKVVYLGGWCCYAWWCNWIICNTCALNGVKLWFHMLKMVFLRSLYLWLLVHPLFYSSFFFCTLCLSKELICPIFFECDGHFVHLNKFWGFLNDLPYKICICLHWYEATANFEDYSLVFLFPSRGLDRIAALIWILCYMLSYIHAGSYQERGKQESLYCWCGWIWSGDAGIWLFNMIVIIHI